MKNLIIPAAGKSSRFPNMKPKWMLTHPNGDMMIVESISGLNLSEFDFIYVTTTKEILNKYEGAREGIKQNFLDRYKRNICVVELDNSTRSQSETVYQTIIKANISGSILVKDSDGFFSSEEFNENCVCYCDASLNDVSKIQNKSFLTFDEQKLILNIVEKQIISKTFSVGGYFFKDCASFMRTYEELSKFEEVSEVYISNIINKLILENEKFYAKKTSNFSDWGTIEDWEKYKENFKTIFIDIDGVLFKNASRYFFPKWGQSEPLEKNIDLLKKILYKKKYQIILTTARNETAKEETIKQLEKYDIKYDKIIFGLNHAKRVIINDFSKTNKYPSCEAINIKRDQDDLELYFD